MSEIRSAILAFSVLAAGGSVACAQVPLFNDGFENAQDLEDLFPRDGSRWTTFGATGEGNFIELTRGQTHSGTQALRCFAMPSDAMTTSKAFITQRHLLQFAEGDEGWFEGWFFIESDARPFDVFLWDLESTRTCTSLEACPEEGDGSICSSPGRRLYLQDSAGTPVRSDLGKWCLGEDFVQEPGSETPFPIHRWVRLRVFIGLSNEQAGIMQVWQDDTLVLHNRGYTLPRANSIYDSLQIGITANGGETDPVTLLIDDVTIWDAAPTWWLAIMDRDADKTISIDDLYELHKKPADLNGDGIADRSDIDLLEDVVRWDERRDMSVDR